YSKTMDQRKPGTWATKSHKCRGRRPIPERFPRSGIEQSFVVIKTLRPKRAAPQRDYPRLSLTRVQFVDCPLQLFKLLPRLAELAFGSEALVVGKVSGCFRDERVEIGCGLGRSGGYRCTLHRLRGDCRGVHRRARSTKKRRRRRLESWSIRKPILQREHD